MSGDVHVGREVLGDVGGEMGGDVSEATGMGRGWLE